MIALPPSPYWLLTVEVAEHGGCVPYECWLLYHFQFFICRGDVV